MKVYQRGDYSTDFPERFNWDLLESRHLTEIARDYARLIQQALRDDNRDIVPGLRIALRVIGRYAEVLS